MTEQWSYFEWSFPGGIAGIAVVLAAGLALIALSYALALHRLKPGRIALLTLLRLAVLGLIVLCLADPRRVDESVTVTSRPRKMLAVFDTSSSMRIPGILGPSRLETALAAWDGLAPEGGECRIAGFDSRLGDYPGVEFIDFAPAEAVRPTHLTAALRELAQRADRDGLDAVACFTDGIDTSLDGSLEECVAAVAASRARFHFFPATVELAMKRYAALTRIEAPGQVLVNARVAVAVLAGYSNLTGGDELALEVRDAAGEVIYSGAATRSGAGGTAAFRFEAPPAEETGVTVYYAELLLNGASMARAAWSVEAVARERRRVLLYQGSLDWAARFYKTALGRGAERTSIDVRTIGDKVGNGAFPGSDELGEYDAVLLLNLERKQIDPAMEEALKSYLSGGGGVLFITGNPLAAAEFANSELEALLPVEFESELARDGRSDQASAEFRRQIEGYRRTVNDSAESTLVGRKEDTFRPEPMIDFALTPAGEGNPIFRRPGGGLIVPQFLDYALVRSLKPGAQALATHPGAEGGERVIFAVQRYGAGRSAMLATDPLWRWKLALPSESRDFESFWENLAGWLGSAGRIAADGWRIHEKLYGLGASIPLEFRGGAGRELRFEAVGPGGAVELALAPGREAGILEGAFTPSEPGIYRLCAEGFPDQWLTVAGDFFFFFFLQLTPDLGFFAALAALDNVRVWADGAPADFDAAGASGELRLSERAATPLWWHAGIFLGIVVLYMADLMLRRKWRLV